MCPARLAAGQRIWPGWEHGYRSCFCSRIERFHGCTISTRHLMLWAGKGRSWEHLVWCLWAFFSGVCGGLWRNRLFLVNSANPIWIMATATITQHSTLTQEKNTEKNNWALCSPFALSPCGERQLGINNVHNRVPLVSQRDGDVYMMKMDSKFGAVQLARA